MSEIVKALAAVMAEVGSVRKGDRNQFHGYDYAGTDDVAHAVQGLMAKHGVIIIQTEGGDPVTTGGLATVRYRFFLLHSSGETLSQIDGVPFVHTGVSQASNSKGGLDDKALNKCHTAARKYFLIALFQLPRGKFDDPDADEDQGPGKKAGTNASRSAGRAATSPSISERRPPDTPSSDVPSEPGAQHVDEWILRWPKDTTGHAHTRAFRRTEKGATELLHAMLGAVKANRAVLDIEENQLLIATMEEKARDNDKLGKVWLPMIDEIRDLWANPIGLDPQA